MSIVLTKYKFSLQIQTSYDTLPFFEITLVPNSGTRGSLTTIECPVNSTSEIGLELANTLYVSLTLSIVTYSGKDGTAWVTNLRTDDYKQMNEKRTVSFYLQKKR